MGDFRGEYSFYKLFKTREEVDTLNWLFRQMEYPDSSKITQAKTVTTYLRKVAYIMAGKGKSNEKSAGNSKNSNASTKWLTVRITIEDEAKLDEYAVGADALLDDLCVFTADGGSWTVKPNDRDDGFSAFAFFPVEPLSNTVYAVSAFAGHPTDALRVLHYKLFVVVGDNPSAFAEIGKRRYG